MKRTYQINVIDVGRGRSVVRKNVKEHLSGQQNTCDTLKRDYEVLITEPTSSLYQALQIN